MTVWNDFTVYVTLVTCVDMQMLIMKGKQSSRGCLRHRKKGTG